MIVPKCDNCGDKAMFTESGGMTTAVYYPPIYDANGVNTNPDMNQTVSILTCTCGNKWKCVSQGGNITMDKIND